MAGKTKDQLRNKKKKGLERREKFEQTAKKAHDVITRRPVISQVVFWVLCFGFCLAYSYLRGYQLFDAAETMKMQPTVAPLYLTDYSIGFYSRVLVGEIISWFKTSGFSYEWLTNFYAYVVIVSYAMVSVILSRNLFYGIKNKQALPIVLVIMFLTSPLILFQHIFCVGILDVFWFILTILSILCINKKYLMWLIPIFVVVGVVVQYVYILSYLPVVFAIQLYEICYDKQHRVRNSVNFGFSALTGGIATVYCMFVATAGHVKMTFEEYVDYILAKTTEGTVFLFSYVRMHFFNYYEGGGGDIPSNPLTHLSGMSNFREMYVESIVYLKYLLYCLPVVVVFAMLWCIVIKRKKGFIERFPIIVFMLIPLSLVPSLIISTDVWRWIASAMTSQFLLVFYLAKRDRKLIDIAGEKKPVIFTLMGFCLIFVIASFFFKMTMYG